MGRRADRRHIDELILASLSGKATVGEESELAAWLEDSEANHALFERLRRSYDSLPDLDPSFESDKERCYGLFRARVALAVRARRRRFLKAASCAAALLLFCGLSFYAFKRGESKAISSLSEVTIEAPKGSRTKVALPDGTKVWLNAGSKIAYSQTFGLKDREVRICGEGYFEVEKDPRLPFNLVSESIKVNVLGTKFNFSDYPGDAHSTVTLLEGSVNLQSLRTGEEHLLEPDHRLTVDNRTGAVTTSQCDASEDNLWKDGILVFNGESLDLMARKLERLYDVSISIKDELVADLCFFARFNTNSESLESILENLSHTHKLRYTVGKDGVVVF